MKAWTQQHLEWIGTHVKFDQPALEACQRKVEMSPNSAK
jgi:hypothetical protein